MRIAISLIRALHLGILLFVVFGWIFEDAYILWFHIALLPLILLQWKLNKGRCVLTDLEYFLVGENKSTSEGDEAPGFVRRIVMSVCNVNPTEEQLEHVLTAIMTICWLLSLYKLYG